ncbi:MAG: DUF366 family protein [Bdellovibrionaceae bacterium]|nr:DUF366 family protein [Bdellovibrio sp.]
MKTLFVDKRINYDGSQLKSLFGYLQHKLAGNSIIAFTGACDVSLEHMVDAEDFVVNAKIKAQSMLHFIVEIFGENLFSTVCAQRLLVATAQAQLNKNLRRQGDDLYLDSSTGPKKLSVSIASCSPVSCLIHLGINIENEGTPVPTCSLKDLGVDAKSFALELMKTFSEEFISIVEATQKVKPLL